MINRKRKCGTRWDLLLVVFSIGCLLQKMMVMLPTWLLVRCLLSSSHNVYGSAAAILGRRRSRGAIRALAAAYERCEYDAKRDILQALAATRTEDAARVLERVVRDGTLHTVDDFDGLRCLAECGGAAIESCLRLLDDPPHKDTPFQGKIEVENIVDAIANIADPRATRTLVTLYVDREGRLRRRAFEQLVKGCASIRCGILTKPISEETVVETVRGYPHRDLTATQRALLINLLARLETRTALDLVREEFSRDPCDEVRKYAAGVLDDRKSVPDVFSQEGYITIRI